MTDANLSNGIGHRTTTVIAKALNTHCGEAALAITRLHGGVVNRVFSVSTEHHRYVIRLNQDSLAVFLKEQWAMAQAFKQQVRVPQIFAVGEIDGLSYMLMEHAPGVMLSHYQGNRKHIFQSLGEQLKRLHEVQVEGYGFDLNLTDKARPHFTETWAQVVSGEHAMTFANPSLLAMGALNQRQIDVAIDFMKPMANWKYSAVLCHGDVNPNNVLVDDAHTGCKTTLLDWTGARGGPGIIFDLTRLLMEDPGEFDSFCTGYGLDAKQREALLSDWHRNALKDVLRAAAWAYSVKHERLEKFAEDVREVYRRIFPD